MDDTTPMLDIVVFEPSVGVPGDQGGKVRLTPSASWRFQMEEQGGGKAPKRRDAQKCVTFERCYDAFFVALRGWASTASPARLSKLEASYSAYPGLVSEASYEASSRASGAYVFTVRESEARAALICKAVKGVLKARVVSNGVVKDIECTCVKTHDDPVSGLVSVECVFEVEEPKPAKKAKKTNSTDPVDAVPTPPTRKVELIVHYGTTQGTGPIRTVKTHRDNLMHANIDFDLGEVEHVRACGDPEHALRVPLAF